MEWNIVSGFKSSNRLLHIYLDIFGSKDQMSGYKTPIHMQLLLWHTTSVILSWSFDTYSIEGTVNFLGRNIYLYYTKYYLVSIRKNNFIYWYTLVEWASIVGLTTYLYFAIMTTSVMTLTFAKNRFWAFNQIKYQCNDRKTTAYFCTVIFHKKLQCCWINATS